MGQGCGGTGLAGLDQELVGIETLALQGDEQIPGLQRAGVGVHAREHGLAVADQPCLGDMRLDQLQRLLQGHHDRFFPSRAASALRASAMSENGWRWPAVSW